MHWLRSVHIAIDLTHLEDITMDYPVMLYRNSFDDWKIADDEEHEKELLKTGYMSHADFMAKDDNGNGALDIAEMTKKDIMQGLDDLEIEYNNRDSKDTLAEILADALSE